MASSDSSRWTLLAGYVPSFAIPQETVFDQDIGKVSVGAWRHQGVEILTQPNH